MGLRNFYTLYAKDGTIQSQIQELGGRRLKRETWKERVLDEARLGDDRRPADLILEDYSKPMGKVKQFLLDCDKRSDKDQERWSSSSWASGRGGKRVNIETATAPALYQALMSLQVLDRPFLQVRSQGSVKRDAENIGPRASSAGKCGKSTPSKPPVAKEIKERAAPFFKRKTNAGRNGSAFSMKPSTIRLTASAKLSLSRTRMCLA
jgi:hypothetical protein